MECIIDELPIDVATRIGELDRQLNALTSTGFDDTSIVTLNSDNKCPNLEKISSWLSTLSTELDGTLDIGQNIKCLLRVICEGSTLEIQQLSVLVHRFIDNLPANTVSLSLDKIQLLIPVLMTKKSLDKNGNIPFYWESPYIETFPDFQKEAIKRDRKVKFSIVRKYRAIVKVKESLISGKYEAIDKANEALNKILKLELVEKEKLARRKSLEELRERNEAMKESKKRVKELQMEAKKKEAEAKKREKELRLEAKKREIESKKLQQMEEKATKFTKIEKKISKFNMLLSWLKPQQPEEEAMQDESMDEDILQYSNHLDCDPQSRKLYLKVVSDLPNVGQNYQRKLFLDLTHPLPREQILDELEQFIITTCKEHREKWNRYMSFVSNPIFEPLESTSGTVVQINCGKNTTNHIYLDESLPDRENCTPFFMYDNMWKRPSMKLIVNKRSTKINTLNPLAQEPIDYSTDTDDEWFEQCDFDNVDDSGSEEEEDEFEDDEWLVPDRESDMYGVNSGNHLSNCAAIYCDCGWDWTLDGVPIVSYQIPGGYNGFYGFNDASFNPLELSIQGRKFDISSAQEIEIIQFCHGKSCSRDKLIEDLKCMPILMLVPKAAIIRCINKNIIRQRAGNKTTWIIAPEAVDRLKGSLTLMADSVNNAPHTTSEPSPLPNASSGLVQTTL